MGTLVVMVGRQGYQGARCAQRMPSRCCYSHLPFPHSRSFRREISCEKMGITSGQRQLSLELVQKMAYSSTEEEYAKVHSEFQRDVPKVVKKYFEECWHHIRKEWVMGLKAESGSFLNTTNNRLESINGKLKQVISRHSSLEKFIDSFLRFLPH